MMDSYPRMGTRSVLIAIVVITLGGSGVISGLVFAAAKGAFGKLGEVGIGWLIEHSASPKDLELQRELVRSRLEEEQREGAFRRKQAEDLAQHQRDMELRRQAAIERNDGSLAAAAKMAGQMRQSPQVVYPPVVVPQGTCVLVNGSLACNPPVSEGGTFAGDGWGQQQPQGYDPTQNNTK